MTVTGTPVTVTGTPVSLFCFSCVSRMLSTSSFPEVWSKPLQPHLLPDLLLSKSTVLETLSEQASCHKPGRLKETLLCHLPSALAYNNKAAPGNDQFLLDPAARNNKIPRKVA